MKHRFTLFFLGSLLLSLPTLAQRKASKKPDVAGLEAALKRRNDEITFQARNKIARDLLDLMNLISFEEVGEAERNSVIKNSFLPNSNQIFYDDAVIVEDDIDPSHTSSESAVDVNIEKYLRNLDLFYSKSNQATISFSQIVVSDVYEGDKYPYVKVYFTSTFGSKHNQLPGVYKPIQRVAELRAEKVGLKWRTYITRLAFLRPDETPPLPPILSREHVFSKVGNLEDSVAIKLDLSRLDVVRSKTNVLPVGSFVRKGKRYVRADSATITLARGGKQFLFQHVGQISISFKLIDPQIDHYRRLGWIQIATGVAALAASYVGYSSLQNSYDQYKAKLTNLNAEYAIWQSLSQQPGGSRAEPMAFGSYASPGIYAVYGGGVAGSGLILNGLRHLRKARKLSR